LVLKLLLELVEKQLFQIRSNNRVDQSATRTKSVITQEFAQENEDYISLDL